MKRGFNESVVDKWDVYNGVGPLKGRMVLPIYGLSRRDRIGTTSRAMTPGLAPKYLHSKGLKTSRWLYGLWQPITTIPVLVEGPLDAWAITELGYTSYAVLGTALSAWHAAHIAGLSKNKTCIIIPDSDMRALSWANTLQEMGVAATAITSLYNNTNATDPHELWLSDRELLKLAIDNIIRSSSSLIGALL